MRIPQPVYEAMVDHAVREAPLEACGIVGGRGEEAVRFYPTPNAEASPIRYRIPPLEILRVMRELDDAGLELIAVFHSHPATRAYPSATDVRLAFYPDAVYLILSLEDPDRPDLRGYRIRDGQITPVDVAIV